MRVQLGDTVRRSARDGVLCGACFIIYFLLGFVFILLVATDAFLDVLQAIWPQMLFYIVGSTILGGFGSFCIRKVWQSFRSP